MQVYVRSLLLYVRFDRLTVRRILYVPFLSLPSARNDVSDKKRATKCAITGRPAKYRDPLTGMTYANLDAFRELRRRHNEETSRSKGD